MLRHLTLLTLLTFLTLLGACDDTLVGASGTVTLQHEEGVEFIDGTHQRPGNYRDSDLIAFRAGSSLSLVTGGPNPTVYRPINWFVGGGGVMRRFDSLADVPTEAPSDAMASPNNRAQVGHGFVALTSRGTYTRGWIAEADGSKVTIEFQHLANPILPQ